MSKPRLCLKSGARLKITSPVPHPTSTEQHLISITKMRRYQQGGRWVLYVCWGKARGQRSKRACFTAVTRQAPRPTQVYVFTLRLLQKEYSLLIGLRRGSVAENRNLSALPQKETPILAKPVIDHLVNRVASVTRGSG